ncbi:PREDICTED: uncharacterized protein LOC109641528 [Scomber scombrus]|uniref:PREDICTED: uncharacterized protein LOC109641528 n=1 Tax=Scomber scombrus TaxID=13677 RepID=A0AAV1QE64_SCOSC
MKTKFRAIFLKALEVHHTFVPQVITACAVLHNICLGVGDIMPPQDELQDAMPEDEEEEEENRLEAVSGFPWRDRLSAEVSALEEASGGDTAQSDTVVDSNDVPELLPEEEDEQKIYNIQNNKDITGEDAQPKVLIQDCEDAQDVRVVHNDDINKEEDTDHAKQYGQKNISPVMIICDGSMVLMQAISMAFCQTNLNALLQSYFTALDFSHPILHRCLSHIMKNAKTFCKKHTPKNYKMAMHVFGLLTSARSIGELDEILHSCTVIFSSPCSSGNVEKHFNKIQTMLTTIGDSADDDSSIVAEDLEVPNTLSNDLK